MSKSSGYRVVHYPQHHRAWSTGYVHVHILVAEWKLGRLLYDGETVHHLDENKLNNSPENIAVVTNPEHGRLHGELRAAREHIVLRCGFCGKELRRPKSRTPAAKGCKQAFCNSSCAGKATGFKKIKDYKHGTASAYNYHRCRCELCRKFKRDEARKWRAKKNK